MKTFVVAGMELPDELVWYSKPKVYVSTEMIKPNHLRQRGSLSKGQQIHITTKPTAGEALSGMRR